MAGGRCRGERASLSRGAVWSGSADRRPGPGVGWVGRVDADNTSTFAEKETRKLVCDVMSMAYASITRGLVAARPARVTVCKNVLANRLQSVPQRLTPALPRRGVLRLARPRTTVVASASQPEKKGALDESDVQKASNAGSEGAAGSASETQKEDSEKQPDVSGIKLFVTWLGNVLRVGKARKLIVK